MNTRLEGGCQVPIGSYAIWQEDKIWLRALVGSPDGETILRRTFSDQKMQKLRGSHWLKSF